MRRVCRPRDARDRLQRLPRPFVDGEACLTRNKRSSAQSCADARHARTLGEGPMHSRFSGMVHARQWFR
jgi:hypothetical protein